MTRYLKLENITGKFNVPCVMDIKIGKVTWDDDVDNKFKEERRKKWPLKEITGFSILGFMVCASLCYIHVHSMFCFDIYSVLFSATHNQVQNWPLQFLSRLLFVK